MKLRTLARPSPALTVSIAALVVALGGTSYAAGLIGGADVRNGSLTGKDLKDGSVRVKDIAPNAYLQGPEGEQGPQGPAGVGRWVLVNAAGQIEAQSGGFEITTAYPVLTDTDPGPGDNSLRANGNVYIDANEPLDDNGIVAVVALQNTVDQNGDTITSGRAPGSNSNPEFSGEISATQCQITGVVACGPPAAQNINNFVVSPRLSDGGFTDNTNRKRFYVIITGDSTGYVAP